ncbi:MAG: hypothetical protein M3Q73_01275 [bacterium]|nr:hypothetical protein [bacterium]
MRKEEIPMKKVGSIKPLGVREGLTLTNRPGPRISADAREKIRRSDVAKAKIPTRHIFFQ